MKGISHENRLKSCSRTGGGREQFRTSKPGEANRRAAAQANLSKPRKAIMGVAGVSGGMKPASLRVSTKQPQGTLRGHGEQRDGTAMLGTWEVPAARTVSAVRREGVSETISSSPAEGDVGEARSSDEAGESRWSEGALAQTSRLRSKKELIGR